MAHPSYTMDLIYQDYPMGCWKASHKMMKSWKTGTSYTNDPSFQDEWVGPNGGLNTDRATINAFCGANGYQFAYLGDPNTNLATLIGMINRGPIMVCGKVPAAHFYVITGMDTDAVPPESTTLDMNDPLPVNVGAQYNGRSLADLLATFGPYAMIWVIQNR